MSSFDDKYWNLSQVAAWVIYRDQQLIEILVKPSREAFAALECLNMLVLNTKPSLTLVSAKIKK
jgi:hypothetical protein